MSTKLTSEIVGYKATGSFRFWCQHVLPLVYDDSLSYYELLCKVVNYLNDVISNVDAIHDEMLNTIEMFNQLKDYVDNYFKNLDVQDEINNKLDDMAEDGTLERIIGDYLGNLDGILQNMTPTIVDREGYKNMIRKNLVSYLVRNNFSDSMTGEAVNTDYSIVYKYLQGNNYMGLYGASTGFIRDDIQRVNGVDYKVAYFDCSSFTTLITRGVPFESSPYAYAFSHPNATDDELFPYGLENPDPDIPYTFDSLNNVKSDNFARIMNNSGNTLQHIITLPNGTVNEDTVKKLETGDIIFMSRNTSIDNYKGIYHCGIFVKSLDELDAYATPYGITFKPIDGVISNIGYIVEVWSQGSLPYKDILVIHSMEYWLTNIVSGTIQSVYMCKGYANTNNSNKQLSLVTGMYRLYDSVRFVNTVTGNRTVFPEAKLSLDITTFNSFVGGRPYQLKNVDIDTLTSAKYNGIWMPYNEEDRASITGNLPIDDNVYFTLIILGADITSKGAKQILIVTSKTQTTRELVYMRQTGPTETTYGAWRCLTKMWQNGTIVASAIAGNTTRTEEITFDEPFPYTPNVQITPIIAGASATFGNTSFGISNITTTGFTLKIFNPTSTSASIGANWIAF